MDIKEQINNIPASEFYQKYLPGFTPNGKKEVVSLCPLHEDKGKPNLSINLETGKYHCFACNKGGDVIQFYMDSHKVDFKTALQNIAKDFDLKKAPDKKSSHSGDLASPQNVHGQSQDQGQAQGQGRNLPPISQKFINSCIDRLEKNPEAIKFLEEKRGISEAIRKLFHIGLDEREHFIIPVADDKGKVCNVRIYNPNPKENEAKMRNFKAGYGSARLFPLEALTREKIIICEGELDALCLLSHLPEKSEYGAITGTGGCQTWKPEWTRAFYGKHVVIAYDHDEGGKEGVQKVVSNLTDIAISIKVIEWPDYFKDKEDATDFFMTYRMKWADFQKLIDEAPEKGYVSPIKEEGGRYFVTKGKRIGPVTNFVINIINKFMTPEGCFRWGTFKNASGQESDTFFLEPQHMASKQEFCKLCFSKGNFIFEGSAQDLTDIWKLLLSKDLGQIVYQPDHIGLLDNGSWLFGDCLITPQGTVIPPDENKIYWLEDKGYKPVSLWLNDEGENSFHGSIPIIRREKELDINKFLSDFKECIGGFEAWMGLGWVIAVLFSKEIINLIRCFPFLIITGRRQSGKSTFARWLMSLFSIEGEGKRIAETTNNALARALSYYSSLPIWLDEYRNTPNVIRKDGDLRGIYDRQGAMKGTTKAHRIKDLPVRGTVLLTGEETPSDNALQTRCVILTVSEYKRNNDLYNTINSQASSFPSFIFKILCQRAEYIPKVLKGISEMKELLHKFNLDERIEKNYAVMAGSFQAILGENEEFTAWVVREAQTQKTQNEDESPVSLFWDQVHYLCTTDALDENFLTIDAKDKKLFVWFQGTYKRVAESLHRINQTQYKESVIKNYLQEEKSYFLEANFVKKMGNGKAQRCMVFDIEEAPENVKMIYYYFCKENIQIYDETNIDKNVEVFKNN